MSPSGLAFSPGLRRVAALVLGFLLSLLASEVLLRAAYLSPGQYVVDPVLGVDRVPHSEVFVGREGGARLVFDRYGLNNDDTVWDRPGPRLAVLGDSFTEAAEVPREGNTVSRLAARFPDLVLLNLGRAALTPPQAAELYRRIVARGERLDLLLLALSGNDLGELEATPELGPDCRLPAHPVGWRQRVTSAVVGSSALLMRMRIQVHDWWSGLRQAAADAPPQTAPAEAADATAAGLEARLTECLRVLSARQPLVVAILPGGNPPTMPADAAEGQRRLALYTRAAEAAGAIGVIDAWSAFGTDPLGDGRLVNGFPNATLGRGHLNLLGHARLAEVLAEGLAPLLPGLPPPQVPRMAQGGGSSAAGGTAP